MRIKEDIAQSLLMTYCYLHAYIIVMTNHILFISPKNIAQLAKVNQITEAIMHGEVYGNKEFHINICQLISRLTKLVVF